MINCPEDAEAGDVVVLPSGACVPFVLRTSGSSGKSESKTFSFIGDAYVTELMGRTLGLEGLEESEWFIVT